jgi:hypothetical protein
MIFSNMYAKKSHQNSKDMLWWVPLTPFCIFVANSTQPLTPFYPIFHPNPSTTITTVTPQYSTCKIVTPKKLFLLFSPIYPHLNTKFSKKEINPTAKNNLPLQPFFSACTYTPSSKPTEFELLNTVRSCTIESLSLSISMRCWIYFLFLYFRSVMLISFVLHIQDWKERVILLK